MRKSVLLIASVLMLVLAGCNTSSTSKEEEMEDKLDQAILNAQTADIIETNIFLDFVFGMTEEEVEAHLNKLVDEKKVYIEDGYFTYTLATKSGLNLYLNFIPKYHDGELYKMIFPISTDLKSETNQYVFARAAFSDTERYKQMQSFITKDVFGETIYTSIKDNLIIKFEDNGGSEMSYSNAPVEKIVKDEIKRENIEKSRNSNSDF